MDKLTQLANQLNELQMVSGYSDGLETEGERLAHAIIDIGRGASQLHTVTQRIVATADSSEPILLESLLELVQELRHIYYHINDSHYLRDMIKN